MRLIVFDIVGYIAHFRKHFTTTSSLSYAFPPRTTICGMIAGVLGFERDSYYDEFSSEKCKVGLKIMKPIRRFVETVNYLMTDKDALDYLEKYGLWKTEPAQIRTELIMVDGKVFSELRYRIFFNHENTTLMEELKKRIINKNFFYPPSLGTANNLAILEYINDTEAEIFRPEKEIYVHTVVPISKVNLLPEKGLRIYVEELVPADFSRDRKLIRKENYLYEGNGKPIKVYTNEEVFKCKIEGEEIIGLFL